MRVAKKSAFTLIELLIASSLTALVMFALIAGLNAFMNHRQLETSKPSLAIECYQVLNMMENDLTQKCTSLGNLVRRGHAYAFEYTVSASIGDHPSLSFFKNSKKGPLALCYGTRALPNAIQNQEKNAYGLFRVLKSENDSYLLWSNEVEEISAEFTDDELCLLKNLISESIVHFEIHLAKFSSDRLTLDYLNTDAQDIRIFQGKGLLNKDVFELRQLAFLEITLWAVGKSQQNEYWERQSDDEKSEYVQKQGIKMSRLVPWYI